MSATLKVARVEFKTTPDTKELLSAAALLDGLDLTSFILSSAIDKARQVLSQHASITLSKKAQENLVNCLNDESGPTEEMKVLMSLPDFPVRKN